MYCYVICDFADDKFFYKQCRALERRIPDLQAEKLLEDVDGTLIQIYHHPKGNIKVWSDVQENGVYIESDFDVLSYFGEKAWTGEKRKFQDHEIVRIKKTGASGKIIGVYYCMGGIVLYDVEGQRKRDGNGFWYGSEELEKID